METFQVLVRMFAVLGVLETLLLLFSIERSKLPLTFDEVREHANGKELRGHHKHQVRAASFVLDVFLISSWMFQCEYSEKVFLESTAPCKSCEKIRITIPQRAGVFTAIFHDEELVAWNLSTRNEIDTEMPLEQLWMLKEILGRIQNAAGLARPRLSTIC